MFLLPTLILVTDSVRETSLMLCPRKGKSNVDPTEHVSAGLPGDHLTWGPWDWPCQGEPANEGRQSCLLSDSRDWISISYEEKGSHLLVPFHSLKVSCDSLQRQHRFMEVQWNSLREGTWRMCIVLLRKANQAVWMQVTVCQDLSSEAWSIVHSYLFSPQLWLPQIPIPESVYIWNMQQVMDVLNWQNTVRSLRVDTVKSTRWWCFQTRGCGAWLGAAWEVWGVGQSQV